ncbi:TonB family protein [Sporomusa aerivorans]|uniref:energy transducer TonB n=1 Tax=Sporomusa aerivorans TaxID=204936 RepID=UPI003529E72C
MAAKMSWRRAATVSALVHCLLLAGSGHLFAGLFPEKVSEEQYIELDFQNVPQVAAAQNTPTPLPDMQQNIPQQAVTSQALPQPQAAQRPAAVTPAPVASLPPEAAIGGGDAQPVTAAPAAPSSGSVSSGSASGGIAPPGVLSRVEPVYPQSARQAGINGTVMLKVQVLEDGNPGRVTLSKTSGNDSLDEAAIAAVQQWRFVPARNRDTGRSVVCITTIPVSFRLNG